ncbi:CidA/LrgA family protein [Shewanella gelidimarina]|uniref:CidA/LrgA family protein n=1 Tax=Shewanella gelidimarina TaxID=56813 RepID=UPI00200BE5EF|nr:CidA/LrgA family protein [Shewanella gelidimarina]MCL1058826.1 CidA/LrgA family protein [Shewanella gelidimarina]
MLSKQSQKMPLFLQRFLQIVLFCAFAWACQVIAKDINSPLPGSVIGLGVLLALLSLKWVPEQTVSMGAAWLIGDLLLFFIPPVVAVIKYQALLEHFGLVLISSMLVASTIVLLGTAFTVDRLFKLERKHRLKVQLSQGSNQ